MKKIISALLLLNLVFACKSKSDDVAPVDETGCRQLSYKETMYDGRVAANEVYTYNATKNLIEFKSLERLEKYEYNTKGLRTKKTATRLLDMVKVLEEEYSYDDKDQLIKQLIRWPDPGTGNSTEDYRLYEYHNNGKLKKVEYYVHAVGGLYTRIQYNEQGLVIQDEGPNGRFAKFEYNAGGKVTRTIENLPSSNNATLEQTVEYNSKNLPAKVTIKINNVITGYVNYEYNDKGQETGLFSTSVNGELISKKITGYNGENYSVANYNRNELADRTEYEVLNSRVMKKTYYRKDVFQYSDTYAYDASGNMIRDEMKLSYQANPVIREWAYACD
jgi:YD repeat-containing protein